MLLTHTPTVADRSAVLPIAEDIRDRLASAKFAFAQSSRSRAEWVRFIATADAIRRGDDR